MKPKPMMDRLEAVFDIVPKAQSIADIGTDHGYLAVELITRGRAQHVIAGDVHKGPLESAKQYIHSRGLTDHINCRLGDGLEVTQKGELQGAILCGMGGFLMRDIVHNGPEPLEFYVLQPQNGQAELRHYMIDRGYAIAKEILVKDMGKLYTAFLAIRKDVLNQYIGEQDNKITETHDDGNQNKNCDSDNRVVSCNISGQTVDCSTSDWKVYDELDEDSILWSVGALLALEKPVLWEAYIDHLLYQRRCALTGMGDELAHTEKYKAITSEMDALELIR